MSRTRLRVEGMTCEGCVRSVTRALQAVEGVQEVQVTLEPGEAVVQAPGVPAERLVQAVEDAGFDARPLAADG